MPAMTTSDRLGSPPAEAYVWAWLPGSTEPVAAGRVRQVGGGQHQFLYGRGYLDRSDAISLYGPELPLQAGWQTPPDSLDMAGCLWDASPDSWGQRVINVRLAGGRYGDAADRVQASKLTYLLESGSDRIGALDFQASPRDYVPRVERASLDDLHAAAQALERGDLSAVLGDALVDGTAVGGARPKVLVYDDETSWIAKLSLSSDPFPVVKAEAVAMELARRVDIDVPETRATTSLGRDVLLVERFDRAGDSRLMISPSATSTTTPATTQRSGTAGSSNSPPPMTSAHRCGRAPRPDRQWTSPQTAGGKASSGCVSAPPSPTV
jgi:serine/threonine-protein kinase HipA